MINLQHGDCMELIKSLPDGSVDLILTDPPYGTTKAKWDSVLDMSKIWPEIWRVLKPNGAVLLFGSQPFTSVLITSNLKDFRYEWIWNKRKSANFLQANKQPHKIHENVCVFYKKQPTYNAIKVPNPAGEEKLKKMMAKLAKEKGYVVSKEEAIKEQHKGTSRLHQMGNERKVIGQFGKDMTGDFTFDPSLTLPASIITEEELKRLANAELLKDNKIKCSDTYSEAYSTMKDYEYGPKTCEIDKSLPASIIEVKKDNYGKNIFHPTQKPVELLQYLIKTYSNPNETVLDFTMGSGSTGVACRLEDRSFVGFEMNDKYFEIAKQRINV